MSEIFVVRDPSFTCGTCGSKGHDTNLTGNTALTALLGCVQELKAIAASLEHENKRLKMETRS